MTTKQQQNIAVLLLFILVGFSLIILFIGLDNASEKNRCPEAWIVDNQPKIDESSGSSYMIIDGENVSTQSVDVDWVVENCDVNEPTVVN